MRQLIRFVLPAIIIIVAIVVFLFLRSTRPEAPPVDEDQRRWPIAVIDVEATQLNPSIRLFGQINTEALTSLRARSAGDVKQVLVQSGQGVKQGQLVVRLDALDAQAERDQRLAERDDLLAQQAQRLSQFESDQRAVSQERELLSLAERQLERNRQLAQSNRVSARDVDLAEQALRQQRVALLQRELAVEQHPSRLQQLTASLKRAESQLQIAVRNLTATELIAPETGRIVEVMVARGDRVTANTVLATLVAPSQIELKATLPLRFVTAARELLSKEIPIQATAWVDGVEYQFELDRFAAQTDRSASMAGFFRLVSGDATQLPLGRFIEANMTLPSDEPRIWIPTSALYGRDRVYLIEDNHLKAVNVQLIGEYDRQGEPGFLIQSQDLHEGDQLLASRLPQAVEGLAVDVVSQFAEGSAL